MKKMILVVALSVIVISFTNAQGKSESAKGKNPKAQVGTAAGNHEKAKGKNAGLNNEELATKQATGFVKKFALTAEMNEKLYPIFLERITTVRKAKSTETVDKKAVSAANKKFKASLKKVLTPEQFSMVKKYLDEKKAKDKVEKRNGQKVEDVDGL
jgi:hypothetical protein